MVLRKKFEHEFELLIQAIQDVTYIQIDQKLFSFLKRVMHYVSLTLTLACDQKE